MIYVMAMSDLKNRYVGSFFGFFWSVIQPFLLVSVFWFVFTLGFKINSYGDFPFLIWFLCGFAPWSYFNEMMQLTTQSVINHQALIKRTLFPSEVLPFIYLLSTSVGHMVMLCFLVIIAPIQGISFSWYWLQLPYYWLAMSVFTIGLGWLASGINVFLRDVGQMIPVIMQIWFWATPVFWNLKMFPEHYHWILKSNPMYYIVQGYRDSILLKKGFWESGNLTLFYWTIALTTFVIGGILFKRLQREFADLM